ncbi:MAG: cryptochrome/photolyase family protein [Acidobacteriota bacterium]
MSDLARLQQGAGPRRRLCLILGDQLDPGYLDDFAPTDGDIVALCEVAEESTHVPSHKQRTTLFLSAMRHFALANAERAPIHYVDLDADGNTGSFAGELGRLAERFEPDELHLIRPGEWRVLKALEAKAGELQLPLHLHEDRHFYSSPERFARWAAGRKDWILEHFYRAERKRLDILMDGKKPAGGEWNFDRSNRKALPRSVSIQPPRRFTPDAITREVMEVVERHFPDAPGRLESFGWPVTPAQAQEALEDFMTHRLPLFGDYQDAMRRGEPWLFHSLLSPALNLKLLDPRRAVDAAVDAWGEGRAPLNAVEGFVRQIIGWREFIRGVYWHEGPDYATRNALESHGELPDFYWHGETDMACLEDSVGQVLDNGYGHHIQRLMVTGNFALLAGVDPKVISDWYLGMYVDGVDWVTLPNTLGMVMHADGARVGTKPYASTGAYIHRMGDYCGDCRFSPKSKTGDDACPFTTLYWDFLDRQRSRLGNNRRMAFAWRNLDRLDGELPAIRDRASRFRAPPPSDSGSSAAELSEHGPGLGPIAGVALGGGLVEEPTERRDCEVTAPEAGRLHPEVVKGVVGRRVDRQGLLPGFEGAVGVAAEQPRDAEVVQADGPAAFELKRPPRVDGR